MTTQQQQLQQELLAAGLDTDLAWAILAEEELDEEEWHFGWEGENDEFEF